MQGWVGMHRVLTNKWMLLNPGNVLTESPYSSGMLSQDSGIHHHMKFLKLLFTIALPFATLLTALPSTAFEMGRTCYPNVTHAWLRSEEHGTPINVRDDASTQAYARHIGYSGDELAVVDRTMGNDGYCWYKVKFVSKAVGWVRGDFIMPDLGE